MQSVYHHLACYGLFITALLAYVQQSWAFVGRAPCMQSHGSGRCLRSSSTGEDFAQQQQEQTADKASDASFKELLKLAKEEDLEWLEATFGDSLLSEMTEQVNRGEARAVVDMKSTSVISKAKSDEASISSSSSSSTKHDPLMDAASVARLERLGYSAIDRIRIAEPVLKIILQKEVKKPRVGVPTEWLRPVETSPGPTSELLPESGNSPESEDSPQKQTDLFSFLPRFLKNSQSREMIRRDLYDDDENNGEKDPTLVDDGASSFWPDKEEFKDMLISESKFRADLVGDWVIPIIKFEAKFRYNAYRAWFDYVSNSLNDGFEAVKEEFDSDIMYADDGVEDKEAPAEESTANLKLSDESENKNESEGVSVSMSEKIEENESEKQEESEGEIKIEIESKNESESEIEMYVNESIKQQIEVPIVTLSKE